MLILINQITIYFDIKKKDRIKEEIKFSEYKVFVLMSVMSSTLEILEKSWKKFVDEESCLHVLACSCN